MPHCNPPDRRCAQCRSEALPPFDPDCADCGGDGYVDYYGDEQSIAEACGCWRLTTDYDRRLEMHDEDRDGFFDGFPVQRARFYASRLDREFVSTIVMHCGNSSSPNFGKYFANPLVRDKDGLRWRRVSAHAAVLDSGAIHQFVPFTHRALHAGVYNRVSLGIEHQGPHTREDWPAEMIEASVDLVKAYCKVYPGIRTLAAHSALAPRRRRDPGEHFPWHAFEDLGLEVMR